MTGVETLLLQLRADLASVRTATSQINSSVNGMMNNINNTTRRGMNSVNNTMQSSTSSIMGAFKKIGMAAAAAFSVKAIIGFGAECVKLGSDLAEVQNVVDVTFGASAETINKFAKNAATSFGISELSAKKYTGVLGSMLKSMGLTTQQATDMSMKMSGLAGDFASFYNLSTDEAFDKVRAGISGETEPLKQLGINMSVANLEAYALANGIRKGYDAMSQQEQALLRYNYLLSVSGDAQGDFARTSNSWANQVGILKLNFDSLKATLGQTFIAILTPVLQLLNKLVGWLNVAATGFAGFIATITGTTQKAITATAKVVDGIGDVSKATSDGVTKASNNAVKAAKKATGSISGLDELVTLSKSASEDTGADTGAAGLGGVGAGTVSTDVGETSKNADELGNKLSGIFDKFKGIKDLVVDMGNAFKDGFINRLKDVSFDKIFSGLKSIGKSLSEIGAGTSTAFSDMLVKWAGAVGSILGSVTKVGIGIGEALIQGIALFLEQNKGRLIETLNTIFNNLGSYFESAASITGTIADLIYGFFTDSNTQQAIADCINIMSQLVLEPVELVSKFLADSFGELDIFFKNLAPLMGTTLTNMADLIQDITGTIAKVVTDLFTVIGTTYDTYVRPALTNFREGFEKIVTAVLEGWNTYMYPVIKQLIEEFNRVYDAAIKPLIEQIGEFVGKCILAASEIYNKFIAPLVVWFIQNLWPGISRAIGYIGNVIGTLVELVAGVAKGVIKALGGIIDFLMGVFTGDWKRAWGGLKDIVVGIWDALAAILKAPINLLIDGLNYLISGINQVKIDIPDWVPGVGGKKFGFSIPRIPKLADGGIVTSATQFIAGEAGAEVVFPLQNSRFIQDFAKYVADSLGGNGAGGVNFNIGTLIQDDRSYEWLSDMMAKFMTRNGYLSNSAF